MKLAFMTLGCPTWDLDTICRRGKEYGYDGVDFRGYLDTLDITLLPLFTTHAAETLRRLNGAGLEVSAVSSSIQVCVTEKARENLEEARRTIATARALNCTNVRIFGSGDLKSTPAQNWRLPGAAASKVSWPWMAPTACTGFSRPTTCG